MQGLIYNLLADLAERAGCQDEAWDVALRSALGDTDDDEPGDEENEDLAEPELPPLGATTGTTFRCLLRSAAPFRDEDWDLADTESAASRSTLPEMAELGPGSDETGAPPRMETGKEPAVGEARPSATPRPRRR